MFPPPFARGRHVGKMVSGGTVGYYVRVYTQGEDVLRLWAVSN